MRTLGLILAALALVLGPSALAEPASPTSAPGPTPTPTPTPGKPAELPAQIKLGVRVGIIRSSLGAIPTLVIVPDPAAYLAAVGNWSTKARFPVLIDDGSWRARENIARFVRAFEPTDVVRWTPGADAPPLPVDEAGRRAAIEAATARAWDAPSAEALPETWKTINLIPQGLVAARALDPAWTAALALAAGHGQPLIWVQTGPPFPADPNGQLTPDQAHALMDATSAAAKTSGHSYKALGDDLDAVTLCLNCPVRVAYPSGDKREMLALTDLVGRDSDAATSERWAWTAQIFGDEASCAYVAMCSLFLNSPDSGWLFDGYEDGEPWNQFDASKAAVHLEKAGFPTRVFDNGRQGAIDFRRATVGKDAPPAKSSTPGAGNDAGLMGLDAGLITVNTSGNEDFFDLRPGQCKPGDVPVLRRPSMVYFVHSWSAKVPADLRTIAGRWRDRGVYAYVGSVHEPYLQAFVPTPIFVARVLAGFPFAAAARIDRSQPWRITLLGDPLAVFTQPIPRSTAKLPLEGALSIEAGLREALTDKHFDQALTILTLLGRDRDGARLLAAVIKDNPAALTPELALAGLGPAFLRGDQASFLRAYAAARPLLNDPKQAAALATPRDMLWQIAYPSITTLTPEQARWLGESLRPESYSRDAGEAFRAIQRASGDDAARDFLRTARTAAPSEGVRLELNRIVP